MILKLDSATERGTFLLKLSAEWKVHLEHTMLLRIQALGFRVWVLARSGVLYWL